MKKLILSICLVGAATIANAQKSEVNEAEKKWNLYNLTLNRPEDPGQSAKKASFKDGGQPAAATDAPAPSGRRSGGGGGSGRTRMEIPAGGNPAEGPKKSGTYLERQLDALYDGIKHTDNAIANEKSKVMPEAWAFRALFASSIAFVDTLNVQNSLKYQGIAEEAIAKAKTLNPTGVVEENLKYADEYVNTAIARRGYVAYNRKDFKTAYDQFVLASTKNPNDTSMYSNIAFVANQLKDYPAAITNYKKAISMNSKDSKAYYSELMKISLEGQKDTAGALKVLEEATAKYPDEIYFITNAASLYMAKGDTQKADALIDKLIEKDPKNPIYLKVKADNYFNQAYDTQEAVRKLEDAKKYKEADVMIKKKADYLNMALPLYLKMETIDPKNVETVKMIKQIYFSLGNNEKAAEYAKKQEGLN